MIDLTISCRVQGIPAQARLLSYSPFRDGRRGHPDSWLPDEPEYLEYEILDRRGYSAPWLERKLTPDDRTSIESALLEARKEAVESSREYPDED